MRSPQRVIEFNSKRYADTRTQELYKQVLGNRNYILVDIGARKGLLQPWKFVEPIVDCVLFEPDPEEAEKLTKDSYKNSTIIPCAVWDDKGEFPLYVTRHPSLSSMLKPNDDVIRGTYTYDINHYELERIESVQTDKLGPLLREYHVPLVDFIKTDIQGGEAHVYNAIDSEQWDHIIGVQTEAYSSEMYEGGATIADLLDILYRKGLELFDIDTIVRTRMTSSCEHELIAEDLLGVRPYAGLVGRSMVFDLLLLRSRRWLLDKGDSDMMIKAIFTYCLFDFYDWALDLTRLAGDEGIIDKITESTLTDQILSIHKASLSFTRRTKEKYRIKSYKLPKI